MENKPNPKARSKKELAAQYGIDTATLRRWLKRIADLDAKPAQKILTPKQLLKIFEAIGEP